MRTRSGVRVPCLNWKPRKNPFHLASQFRLSFIHAFLPISLCFVKILDSFFESTANTCHPYLIAIRFDIQGKQQKSIARLKCSKLRLLCCSFVSVDDGTVVGGSVAWGEYVGVIYVLWRSQLAVTGRRELRDNYVVVVVVVLYVAIRDCCWLASASGGLGLQDPHHKAYWWWQLHSLCILFGLLMTGSQNDSIIQISILIGCSWCGSQQISY